MRTSLVIVLVLCIVSVSLASRHHKKHHRRHRPRVDVQVPQSSQPYYEPDVFYEAPISSDDNQNMNDGWEYNDEWTKAEQQAPAVDDGWSNAEQLASVDDGWSNPVVDSVDSGFENPAPVDPGFDNPDVADPALVDPGFENPTAVDSVPVPVDDAWGKEEDIDQNGWIAEEDQDQPEIEEPEDSLEVDWREAQQERKPWFDEQVEIRHEKVPAPTLEEYDDGFEEEPVDDIDGIDMVGVDSFDDTNGEVVEYADSWENQAVDEDLDTSEEFYSDESESAESSSETNEKNMDTSEELYKEDSESLGYSSETSEEDYTYGKPDGHDGWNRQEGGDAREGEEADIWWTSTTPADSGVPESIEMLPSRWRAFTAWHYAVFAVAGAVFLIGFMIIMVAAIRAVRYRGPAYRRLMTEKAPVAV